MKNFLALTVAAALIACGGGSKNVKSGGADSIPEWLNQGTGAFGDESGKKLQGVGSAQNADPKARRKAADRDAAQQLQGSVEALARAMGKVTESTKENVGDEIVSLTRKAAQAVAHVRDHYVTPDGSENALDQIDLKELKAALQNVEGDESLKRELSNNVDRAYDQLGRKAAR